jgi:uncharacterized protein DUF6624
LPLRLDVGWHHTFMSEKNVRRSGIVALALALGGACARHGNGTLPATDAALRAELLRRVSADQAIRERFASSLRDGKQPDSVLIARMQRVDAENTKWLAEMMGRRGWLGPSVVGQDGAAAALLLVQHADADTAFQARVLSLLARAYRAGQATGQQFALLTDRVATARGAPQVYGTQVALVAGRAVLKPIVDSARVDARRASVGLPPLRDYLRLIDSAYAAHPTH